MTDPRLLHAGAVVLLVVLAGCLSVGGSPSGTTVPPPREYPAPPETLTNETARDAALAHEEAYVHNRLRTKGYRYFAVPGWMSASATVLNRSDRGAYVRVEMPYTYAQGDAVADASVEAVYVVSTDAVRRVNGTGLHLP
jgi:hypothetical protein